MEAASSLLDRHDAEYLEVAATTADDLQALAPRVTPSVRDQVEGADPHLDSDVREWFSSSRSLPRLQLLGPVKAKTRGTALTKRKPFMTELLSYIALHPHGVTPPAQVADAFGITAAKAREYVRVVREWLGTNPPRTGEPHLPDARYGPAAMRRGRARV